MNAIPKAIAQNSTLIKNINSSLNLIELKILILIFLILLSALGIIYIKDLNRRFFITYHKLQAQRDKIQLENSKLIVEYSAYASQSQVQTTAQKQLQMQLPKPQEIIVIKA